MDYIKINKVKDRVNELEKNFSKECQEKLNKEIEVMISKAVKRSTENNRSTVLSRDF
jgi:hypothetical protein